VSSVPRRYLDVTANTTLDYLTARAEGADWTNESGAVLDVESPRGEERVTLGLELDPTGFDHLPHHADYASLTPEQARELASDLEDAATAAERGDAMTSRRG
jgi:hypothetical protein